MMKKQGMNKLTLSAIGMSVLLALSACSSDKATEESATVNEPAETNVVAENAPSAESEAISSESDTEAQVTKTSAVETSTAQAATGEAEVLAADAGATLYESNCKVCHDAGLLNAPKYGDAAAWSARLSKDKETLYVHSAKGFNKMPAQAVDGVTEAQVKAAVDYLLASVN